MTKAIGSLQRQRGWDVPQQGGVCSHYIYTMQSIHGVSWHHFISKATKWGLRAHEKGFIYMRSNDPLLLPSKILKRKKEKKPLPHRSKHLGSASHPNKFNVLSSKHKIIPHGLSLLLILHCVVILRIHNRGVPVPIAICCMFSWGMSAPVGTVRGSTAHPRTIILEVPCYDWDTSVPSHRAEPLFHTLYKFPKVTKWLRPIDSVIGPVRVKRFRTVSYISASLIYVHITISDSSYVGIDSRFIILANRIGNWNPHSKFV